MTKSLISHPFQLKYELLIWPILPLLFCFTVYGFIVTTPKPQAMIMAPTSTPTPAYIKTPNFKHFDTNGHGTVTLLFNNAWKSQYEFGYKYLINNGIKGAVTATSSYIGYPAYWNWQEIQEAQNNDWEIISQGKNYQCEWNKLDNEEIIKEITDAKQDFLNHGIYTQHFASPCGKIDLRLSTQVSSYYASQIIADQGINYLPIKEQFLLKEIILSNTSDFKDIDNWINLAVQNNGWIIFVFDQIEDEQKFQEIITHILDSKIPVVVPSEIIEL